MQVTVNVNIRQEDIKGAVKRALETAMFKGGALIHGEAIRSIMREVKVGRRYRVPGRKVEYTASAPGQAPANRTGNLVSRISILKDTDARGIPFVTVQSSAWYSAWLERGTRRMSARPFLFKAAALMAPKIRLIVADALKGGLK